MPNRLRAQLDDDLVIAPGVWDGLTAVLAEQAGFSALCASGFAISASLGYPDAELYTMTENLQAVRTIREASSLPLVADIDTGYGNAVNAVRTARRFLDAGVEAVFMEDQESPKRCPLTTGAALPLLDVTTAAGKVRAVKDTVGDEVLVIARTDARGDEAIRRALAYVEAGADLIMPVTKTFSTVEEWARCHAEVGVPLMATLTASAWTEKAFTPAVMREIGVGLAILPTQLLMTVAGAAERTLARLARGDDPATVGTAENAMAHDRFVDLIGTADVERLQHTYLPESA
ncbi:isocitrate lyase/PEP mutase family protein [Aeromicrobium camelliae]|uniref:Isocitrate lyase/PEP mutase family protein n=1 Tax=Aeromicrobium camelliae TaxID=1538144 RepID=A0A3N6X4E0_9ACTN|nr:isocitrate lyase/PEP mutase family protein [Aeromicrobium camelliae]RQN08985.1 isocitrate lyase/PEP mutase family protein [Aeromicrobium camelliae]